MSSDALPSVIHPPTGPAARECRPAAERHARQALGATAVASIWHHALARYCADGDADRAHMSLVQVGRCSAVTLAESAWSAAYAAQAIAYAAWGELAQEEATLALRAAAEAELLEHRVNAWQMADAHTYHECLAKAGECHCEGGPGDV